MWLALRSTKGRGPFETEIQARFTPIRVLTRFEQKYTLRVAHLELGAVQSAEHTHEGDWVGEIQSKVALRSRRWCRFHIAWRIQCLPRG